MTDSKISEGPSRFDRGDGDMRSALQPPADWMSRIDKDIEAAGGELIPDEERIGSIGATMFDLPNSEDNTVTVLLPAAHIQDVPSQNLVRIKSQDKRTYLGVVTAGPFAEPDSLRVDSHMLVTVATRGGIFLPPHHGRVQVDILGQEMGDGSLALARYRPLPNSPVFILSTDEVRKVLGTDGQVRLGLVDGYPEIAVRVPSNDNSVFPRHTAILGTTGGGKSTTVAGLICQAQLAGMAVIVLDVEGEYTFLHEPTDDARMIGGLKDRQLSIGGLQPDKTMLYHLVGRGTANPRHPNKRPFSLQFAMVSPFQIPEILELSDGQQDRFFAAYDLAKTVLRDIGEFPPIDASEEKRVEAERLIIELDEFERGYPRLTLPLLLDIVECCLATVQKTELRPIHPKLKSEEGLRKLKERIGIAEIPKHAGSWMALKSRLRRLNRINVFDSSVDSATALRYSEMLKPGVVSIVDLSDSGASQLNNIVISDLLRGLQEAQDHAYATFESSKRSDGPATAPSRVLFVIEEAHEFLSTERIKSMPTLFEQVAQIAKRGRKRWLGLVFVTQLPQHLPSQVLGLVNSFVLHKITDPQVVSSLQRTVTGIDDSLWKRLTGLAPGQAIVSFPPLTRPLLATIDPSPAKLRLVD